MLSMVVDPLIDSRWVTLPSITATKKQASMLSYSYLLMSTTNCSPASTDEANPIINVSYQSYFLNVFVFFVSSVDSSSVTSLKDTQISDMVVERRAALIPATISSSWEIWGDVKKNTSMYMNNLCLFASAIFKNQAIYLDLANSRIILNCNIFQILCIQSFYQSLSFLIELNSNATQLVSLIDPTCSTLILMPVQIYTFQYYKYTYEDPGRWAMTYVFMMGVRCTLF